MSKESPGHAPRFAEASIRLSAHVVAQDGRPIGHYLKLGAGRYVVWTPNGTDVRVRPSVGACRDWLSQGTPATDEVVPVAATQWAVFLRFWDRDPDQRGECTWFVCKGDQDHDTWFKTEAQAQACADALNRASEGACS